MAKKKAANSATIDPKVKRVPSDTVAKTNKMFVELRTMTTELKRREFISAVAALAIVPALPITAMPAVAVERPLRMFTNGYDVLVHFSLEEAKKCLMETCGVTEEEAEGDGWRELPRSRVQGVEVDLDDPKIVDGKQVRMFTNGYDVLVHFSLDEAKKCLMETCGVTEEEAEGDGWRELPRSKVQGVEVDLDDPKIVDGKQVWSEVEKRPVGEWCDEYGPGYFAGYDY